LILTEVKVVCFDTLLQVLILKNLYCTGIVQMRPASAVQENGVPREQSKKRQQDAGVTGCLGGDARRNIIRCLFSASGKHLSTKKPEDLAIVVRLQLRGLSPHRPHRR
jgi:hypothetical protein